MKTNCILRASLHSLINSTPNSNSTTSSVKISRSATSRAKSYGTMRGRQTSNKSTDYPDITAVPCTGKCSSCCCAGFVAHTNPPACWARGRRFHSSNSLIDQDLWPSRFLSILPDLRHNLTHIGEGAHPHMH